MAKKNKKTETENTTSLTPTDTAELVAEDLLTPDAEPVILVIDELEKAALEVQAAAVALVAGDASEESAPAEVPETPKEPEVPAAPKKRGRPRKEGSEPKARREGPAHLAKVDRAAANLPPLSEAADLVMQDIRGHFTQVEMANLAEHINVELRRRSILNVGETAELAVGDEVTVQAGRFAGKTGTVTRVQRIRAYVKLEGRAKDDYFFKSELSPVNQITAIEVTENAEAPAEDLAATGS